MGKKSTLANKLKRSKLYVSVEQMGKRNLFPWVFVGLLAVVVLVQTKHSGKFRIRSHAAPSFAGAGFVRPPNHQIQPTRKVASNTKTRRHAHRSKHKHTRHASNF